MQYLIPVPFSEEVNGTPVRDIFSLLEKNIGTKQAEAAQTVLSRVISAKQ